MIRFDHDFAKVKGNVFSNERMHQLELILSKESKSKSRWKRYFKDFRLCRLFKCGCLCTR